MAIPFIDLMAQRDRIGPKIDAAVAAVLEHGQYVGGPEVIELEKRLAAFCGAEHALSCANGTDALVLALRGWGVGPGDAVFCPSFTFVATAEVLPWIGASPVFVDIDPATYCIDPQSLVQAIAAVKAEGKLRPKAIIAVDLFGQPADYPALAEIARAEGLKLLADCAQSFGCTLNGEHPLAWADAASTSFFPAKPLGAYGDGGAVFTNDPAHADRIDSIRVHGRAVASDIEGHSFDHDPKYLNMRVGLNSRLDTIQAAILLEKLKVFPAEIEMRNEVAARYCDLLDGAVAALPKVIEGGVSTWAQFTVEVEDRDAMQAHLRSKGVPTAVYYPVPLHAQKPYKDYPSAPGGLPVTEAKAERVLSLPMHPDLDETTQDLIVAAVRETVAVAA
ncbi:MAG: DegT/DnrJ/EryC1/StrS aminotransferase family protein [Maricaulaceae bacterium]|jgi:dTDP-4-amino-4,6-dideoxygalactose transaminase